MVEEGCSEFMLGRSVVESLWRELSDVPVDDRMCIDAQFAGWERGTHIYDVWRWFDIQYARHGGVHDLMYPGERSVHNNVRCPVCGSMNVSGGSFDVEQGGCYQSCQCDDCGSSWNDWYRFDSCVDIERGR